VADMQRLKVKKTALHVVKVYTCTDRNV